MNLSAKKFTVRREAYFKNHRVTTRTYDADGNMLTETDVTGTKTYTFNAFKQVLTAKEPALRALVGEEAPLSPPLHFASEQAVQRGIREMEDAAAGRS